MTYFNPIYLLFFSINQLETSLGCYTRTPLWEASSSAAASGWLGTVGFARLRSTASRPMSLTCTNCLSNCFPSWTSGAVSTTTKPLFACCRTTFQLLFWSSQLSPLWAFSGTWAGSSKVEPDRGNSDIRAAAAVTEAGDNRTAKSQAVVGKIAPRQNNSTMPNLKLPLPLKAVPMKIF